MGHLMRYDIVKEMRDMKFHIRSTQEIAHPACPPMCRDGWPSRVDHPLVIYKNADDTYRLAVEEMEA